MSSEVARLCRSESTNRNRGNAGAWRDGVAPKPADTDTVSSVATKELRPPRPSSSIRTRSLYGVQCSVVCTVISIHEWGCGLVHIESVYAFATHAVERDRC